MPFSLPTGYPPTEEQLPLDADLRTASPPRFYKTIKPNLELSLWDNLFLEAVPTLINLLLNFQGAVAFVFTVGHAFAMTVSVRHGPVIPGGIASDARVPEL